MVSTKSTVGVFGASGRTGRRVLERLAARGVATRGLGRHHATAGATETAFVDLADVGSIDAELLRGLEAIYLIVPPSFPDELGLVDAVARAASSAGVRRIVLHSVLHPHTRAMPHHMAHADAEDAIRHSGMAWTILQPGMYMQSVSETFVPKSLDAQASVEVLLPWSPDTPMSPVDVEDVAEVAATVLCEDGHDNATYELAGPDSLGLTDMISAIAAASGRTLTTKQVDGVDFARRISTSAAEAETWAAMFAEYGAHGLTGNPRILGWLLDREPTSFSGAMIRDLQASR